MDSFRATKHRNITFIREREDDPKIDESVYAKFERNTTYSTNGELTVSCYIWTMYFGHFGLFSFETTKVFTCLVQGAPIVCILLDGVR